MDEHSTTRCERENHRLADAVLRQNANRRLARQPGQLLAGAAADKGG